MFSIVIPTYNNLEYLKICINSIKKNSKFNHEIIFYVNEGTDGTLDFLKKNNCKYIYSPINKGVCTAFNKAVEIASHKYVVLGHDDMYFCPEWDTVFHNELSKLTLYQDFFLSGTMVQPFESYINLDCGKTYSDFDEKKLLQELPKVKFKDFQGTHWQPSLIPVTTWNKVGGFSEEFNPGLGSDPDFNMKLWNIGVRLFKGLSDCRVYHFSSISLRKKAWNNGAKTFLLKWGISIKFFKKYYLRSDTVYNNVLDEPKKSLFYYIAFLKCKISFFYLKFLQQF
jgi:glycosyltransferase involved in cell wall biosynthesis